MGKPATDNATWREFLTGGYFMPLAALCFGVWLHAANGTMVATLIPSIIVDIGGARLVAWTSALYDIGSIVAGATVALLSLRYGLRATMIYAAVVYMMGCVLGVAAPNMIVLLAGRLLQGLGGGGLIAATFVAANHIFPRQFVPRAMAAISVVWGAAAFSGPLIGGIFDALGNWRIGFGFFGLQAAVLVLWIRFGGFIGLETEPRQGIGSIPIARLGVLSLGVILIAAAGIDVAPVQSTLLVVAGAICLTLFLRRDSSRPANRLLPERPFALSTPTGAALTMIACFTTATAAFSIYGPVLMKLQFGSSALAAGFVLSMASVGWSVLAFAVSGLPERFDRHLIFAGMCVLTLSILGFVYVMPNGPIELIGLVAFTEGAGFGMSWGFILRRIFAVAPVGERDRVSSAVPTVQRLGYAVGAALAGIIANGLGFDADIGVAHAQRISFWVFTLLLPLTLFGLFAAWRFVYSGAGTENANASAADSSA